MSTIIPNDKPIRPPEPLVPSLDVFANLPLIETDGVPLESPWHRMAMNLLIEVIAYLLRDRHDYFVGGNMFIYYSIQQVRNRDFVGPDFFFVRDVERDRERLWWAAWDEGSRLPDLIVELLSPSTAEHDRTVKKRLYERTFRTHEYFLYDPESGELEGWRLDAARGYQRILPNEEGWLWSEVFGLWLGRWEGSFQERTDNWLRYYDVNGQLVPLRAEAEKQRADKAENELAQIKARLAELEAQTSSPARRTTDDT